MKAHLRPNRVFNTDGSYAKTEVCEIHDGNTPPHYLTPDGQRLFEYQALLLGEAHYHEIGTLAYTVETVSRVLFSWPVQSIAINLLREIASHAYPDGEPTDWSSACDMAKAFIDRLDDRAPAVVDSAD